MTIWAYVKRYSSSTVDGSEVSSFTSCPDSDNCSLEVEAPTALENERINVHT